MPASCAPPPTVSVLFFKDYEVLIQSIRWTWRARYTRYRMPAAAGSEGICHAH